MKRSRKDTFSVKQFYPWVDFPLTNVNVELFWNLVWAKGDDECWPWGGNEFSYSSPDSERGYGRFCFGSEGKVFRMQAHRFAFLLANGPIPDGLVVRHKCDNPECCNPLHLELGNHHQNAMDMVNRGRANPPIGQKNGQAILTEGQALEILLLKGTKLKKEIAKDFGVRIGTVAAIHNGYRWKHLQPSPK